jgi:hypothetical protein
MKGKNDGVGNTKYISLEWDSVVEKLKRDGGITNWRSKLGIRGQTAVLLWRGSHL